MDEPLFPSGFQSSFSKPPNCAVAKVAKMPLGGCKRRFLADKRRGSGSGGSPRRFAKQQQSVAFKVTFNDLDRFVSIVRNPWQSSETGGSD